MFPIDKIGNLEKKMLHHKKECVAMVLAGGQGSRLQVLTQNLAKPAVPFGGKYRIIDFTLSNCVNSHIDTVGILTQYKPLVLNEYIGNGQPWGLDRKNGGVHILPPYVGPQQAEWYKGTANAIYQNMEFISRYHPEYVLVLSGDHIYSMDYREMIEYHRQRGADCTISVIDVPLSEASRFGILHTEKDSRINGFEEKPQLPKSTKASMGIYVFSWKVLREYLIQDEENQASKHDFGANIIPQMLKDGKRLFAFPFCGYWKDVGTIESLWQANMDFIDHENLLGQNQKGRKIYSRSRCLPPHYMSDEAEIKNSLVSEGCRISGRVEHSVIFPGVTIEKDAVIENSVVMPGTVIGAGAKISHAILGESVTVEKGALVSDSGIAVVRSKAVVSAEKKLPVMG